MHNKIVVNHEVKKLISERYDVTDNILYLTLVYRHASNGRITTRCFRIGEEIT